MASKITSEKFGETSDGQLVTKYTIENKNGLKVSLVDFGSSIQSIIVPDRNGKFTDVALGFDNVADYEKDPCYMGALCGRITNRVSKAEITIDGVTSHLSKNDGENHIHGGFKGFNKKMYKGEIVDHKLRMTYVSPDGEEGYPGTLTTVAEYELTDDNELKVTATSSTTKPTAVNLVQHTYFNLAGHKEPNIYDHLLTVNTDQFTPKKEDGYPTGEIAKVSGTVFDFTKPRLLGEHNHEIPGGYDHNYCLIGLDSKSVCAKLEHDATGRVVEVFTNQPGLQVYASHYLYGGRGKDGAVYPQYGAICLETQNYPDAINQPNFPSAVVRPEKPYRHEIVYKFSTKKV